MATSIIKRLFTNTFTNYLGTIGQLISAIFVTRILFLGLGESYYGFWALLWMVFGYSLLLDFGFGTSVQKYTAEAQISKDYTKFNQLINTVFSIYGIMSLLIIVATLISAYYLDSIFSLNPTTDLRYLQIVYLIFGLGVALIFPLGIASELLKGIQRYDVTNYINLIYITLNFIGIYLIFEYKYSLMTLAFFTLFVRLFSYILSFIAAFKKVPGLRLSSKYIKIGLIREVTSFSLFAYLITFTTIIITKTDQILLGIMISVEVVTIYHIGSRIPNFMDNFATQFQKTLSPLAVSLYKAGEHEKLRWIILKSSKIATYISTILFITLFILHKQILFVWVDTVDSKYYYITQLLLISAFIIVLFRSVTTTTLIMTGKHKTLALFSTIESTLNIVLSIIFIKIYGMIGVVYGTLLPNIIFSLFFLFPLLCRFCKMSLWFYLKKAYFPIIVVSIPSILTLTHFTNAISLTQWNFFKLALYASISGGVYAILGFYILFDKDDRNKVFAFVKRVKS